MNLLPTKVVTGQSGYRETHARGFPLIKTKNMDKQALEKEENVCEPYVYMNDSQYCLRKGSKVD